MDDGSNHCTSSTATSSGCASSEQLERATYRDRDGAGSDRVLRLLQEQSDLERTPSRRRERWQHLVQGALEEIGEAS